MWEDILDLNRCSWGQWPKMYNIYNHYKLYFDWGPLLNSSRQKKSKQPIKEPSEIHYLQLY